MKEQASYVEKLNVSGEFNIRTILDVFLSKWYWFVLSVLVCVGLAYVFLQTVPTVYNRTAVVMIKKQSNTEDAFIEKQLFNQNYDVNNEMQIFKSRTLMAEVVRRLSLDREYSLEKGLKRKVLYKDSPIWVEYPDSVLSQSISFTVIPVSQTTYRLTGFPDDPDRITEGTYGQAVQIPGGKIIVNWSQGVGGGWLEIPVQVTCIPVESAIASNLAALEVDLAEKNSTLLALKYQDTNPDRGDAILNTLIDVYNDEAIHDKNQIIQNTAVFINERLAIINEELGGVDSDIENFKKNNRLIDVASEAGIFVVDRSRYEQEEIELSNQIELTKLIRDFLLDPMKEWQLLPANSGIMDTGVDGLVAEYDALLLQRNKLKERGDRSPVVKEKEAALKALRITILKVLDNLKNALSYKLADVQRLQSRANSRIATVPTQEKYVLTVERQQKIKEELYLYLLNKREENALSMVTADSNLRVIDPAYGTGMAGANGMVILLAAFLVGLAIPGLIFYLQPMLDVTVRGRKDIMDNLTIPFLGEIPYRHTKKKKIASGKYSRDGVSEAFRIVRTNMDFMLKKKDGAQVVMMTSANPGAGKSFISLNLAISLSQTGKRVILLEMDIRKGSEKDPDGHVMPGITNFLSGREKDAERLIRPYKDMEGLDVMTSGPIPPNPSELLLTSCLDQLVDGLRERYDYILIDTVPYGLVADAQIISRVADLCIYVIREGVMDRRQLPDVECLYTENKLPNMSVLLNDVHIKHAGYGYGYGYGYYGYGYAPESK
ncbi:polysaccharide biosynthesis tyrosine autokinase [uncultured Parabacteroides sp.]|uniref:GumC family protein n=1 Tax=uncultured Parabacteroides sp. TaxID=512312 RepID=UPI00259B7810|nr:polysaccharide biosynthesis tyrosine autokinase [uncultured Parabacteroides sp.]